MTHTTTDAAEARALKAKMAAAREAFNRTLPWATEDQMWEAVVKAVLPNRDPGRAYNGGYCPDCDQLKGCSCADRLATAEAASGAGEREIVEEAIASPVDDAETQAFIAGWNATRSDTDFDMALHYWMLSSVSPAASLPPATDPAMVERLRIEREGYRQIAINAGWSGSLERAYGRDEYLRHRIAEVDNALANRVAKGWDRDAALAAAPTIPATGEAVPYRVRESFGKWYVEKQFPCINGLSAWFSLATVPQPDEAAVGYTDGAIPDGEAFAKQVVAALNATIPATGHAATEGEG